MKTDAGVFVFRNFARPNQMAFENDVLPRLPASREFILRRGEQWNEMLSANNGDAPLRVGWHLRVRFSQHLHIGSDVCPLQWMWIGREYVMKSLTDMVSESFIWGVGITRPKPGQEHIAAYYITGILVATIAGVAGLFLFALSRF